MRTCTTLHLAPYTERLMNVLRFSPSLHNKQIAKATRKFNAKHLKGALQIRKNKQVAKKREAVKNARIMDQAARGKISTTPNFTFTQHFHPRHFS